jgi:uncharacterized protein
MKKTILFLTVLAAACVSVSADTVPVHFRGVLNLGNAEHFSLATEGGGKTAWVSVGDSFDGYEIARYDADDNVLVVTKDGREYRIGLAGATVAAAPGEPARAGLPFEEAAELMRNMKFSEMMSQSIEQQKEMMGKMFRQMAEQSGRPVNEEELAIQTRFMSSFLDLIDWDGMEEDMARAYGETFTREELKGLIDFYSTTSGQAFINKQGELGQRMSESMQPRIMGAFSKMQPLIQEMEREAKQARTAGPAAEQP